MIGFDADVEILAKPSGHRAIRPVVYSHSKPSGPTLDGISNLELFFWKSSDWAYEREWRIVDSAMSADGEPVAGTCLPFDFRPQAVREVITGCKCSIHLELQAILREPRYQHVAFITAAADREKYKLNFVGFPRSDWDHKMIDLTIAARKGKPKSTA